MVFKRLRDLTASELRTELKRAGIKGKFVKADAIMRLTAHLMDVSEDPFEFEFDPDIPIDELAEDGNPGDYEVTNDVIEPVTSSGPVGDTAASVSGLLNSILAGVSAGVSSATLTTTASPFVSSSTSSTTSSASITTSTVTTSSAAGSSPYPNIGTFPPNAGVQMFNPYNPVMYPGMPGGIFFPQYPPAPTNPGLAGMSQPGPMPPWSGMWTPWGGWTPLGTTPLASAQPTPPPPAASYASPSAASGTSFVLNSAMADFTGACPPPARSSETKSTKIVSGQYDSGRREVKERQNWPQVMIDHILNPETVDYDEMDWASLTAGMTGKILAEMDPSVADTATINKIKHLNRLANYGMKTPMKSILNFNAVLFRAVENKALSWQSWDKIDQFHTRHLSSLTVAAATSGVGKTTSGSVEQAGSVGVTTSKKEKPNWMTLMKSMGEHHICFKFNKGKCDQEEDHDMNGNGKILLHACGLCSYSKRGIVKNHGSQECKPDFWPSPFRTQHRTTGGGSAQ